MPHLHPIAIRLARLEAAYEALAATLGHDDVARCDWRLASHLAIGQHGLRRLVQEHRAELASALHCTTMADMVADMVARANAHATDTAGS